MVGPALSYLIFRMIPLLRPLSLLTGGILLALTVGCKDDPLNLQSASAHIHFTGRLVDHLTKAPLPNIALRVYGVDIGGFHDETGTTYRFQTDADGKFDVGFLRWSPATIYAFSANDSREPGWQPNVSSQQWDVEATTIPKDGQKALGTLTYLEMLEALTVTVENVAPVSVTDTFTMRVSRLSNPVLTPSLRYWGYGYSGWQLQEPYYTTQTFTGSLRGIDPHARFTSDLVFTGGAGAVTRTYWAPCGEMLLVYMGPWTRNYLTNPSGSADSRQVTLVCGTPQSVTLAY